MGSVSRSALVPYSAKQMFKLVNDIDCYPEFVPWCVKSTSELLSEKQKQATLHFARGAIKTSFTTQNELEDGERIDMQLIDGPFKHLHGDWKFIEIEGHGSRVQLDLEFELSNRMLKLALEAFFNQICDRLVNSFVERADQIYS
ncbi:MAG: type II toxin-antitoxin system RatA family toxin [Pseudomonadota bacterium]